MKKASRNLTALGSPLTSALKSLNLGRVLQLARIQGEWQSVVGEKLAAVSAPAKLERKILTIWVAEPVWADSMGYLKKEIMSRINALSGEPVVERLRITHKADVETPRIPVPEPSEPIDPAMEEKGAEDIEPELSSLPDSQLRSTFKRVILKDRTLKKRRLRDQD